MGKYGKRLVTPDIERAHGHRLGCERLEHLAIGRVLLFLHRKGVARHERKFGAIEPDLIDAEIRGDVEIGHQPDVERQPDVDLIRRCRLETAQTGEPGGELPLVQDEPPVFLDHGRQRVDEDASAIAIDDDRMPVEGPYRASPDPHHSRNAEAAGEHRRMRYDGTAHADDAAELPVRHVGDTGKTDLVAEEDHVARILLCRTDVGYEVQEDAATDCPDVLGARPQIGIACLLEHPGVLGDRVAERAGRPVALAYPGDDVLDQVVLSEDQDVHVEYRARLVGQSALHPIAARAQRILRFMHGTPQVCFFMGDIVGHAVGHRIEICQRRRKNDAADRHTRRSGQALDQPDRSRRARIMGRDGAAQRRIAQRRGQLRADRDEEGDLVVGEHPLIDLLDDEHAHGLAEMDKWHRQKTGKLFFARLRKVAVARVFSRIREIDGLLARGDHSDDPFAGRQADLAHGIRVQPFGRHQHVLRRDPVADIDGTYVGAHRGLHLVHDDLQRLVQVARGVDALNDLLELG